MTGRFLEHQGFLERDVENSDLAGDTLVVELMDQLKTNVRYWLSQL